MSGPLHWLFPLLGTLLPSCHRAGIGPPSRPFFLEGLSLALSEFLPLQHVFPPDLFIDLALIVHRPM